MARPLKAGEAGRARLPLTADELEDVNARFATYEQHRDLFSPIPPTAVAPPTSKAFRQGQMKAIKFDNFGGPDVLQLRDVEIPEPASGQVRVCASAIAVNYSDIMRRSGVHPIPLPTGLGLDAVGIVDAVGPGVSGFKYGDRVAYSSSATTAAYAEAQCVAEESLLPAPADIADDVLVSALAKGLTAQYLLRRTFRVQPGQFVLFQGAAGGVGSLACQWIKALGATAIGTVGSEHKIAAALANGCSYVVSTQNSGWSEAVRAFTGGVGVHVAYDCIGKDTFEETVNALAIRGYYVGFGWQSGPPPPIDLSDMRSRGSYFFTQTYGGHYAGRAETQEAFEEVLTMIRTGAMQVRVTRRFPLNQAQEAHAAIESRHTTGSIVLIP